MRQVINSIHNFLKRPIVYLKDKLSERHFFILSSIIIGATSGLAAIALKSFVHFIESLVTFYSTTYEEFFLFALFPLIGIVLTVFYVRYFLNNNFKKGSAEIVYRIVKKSSIIPSQQMYSHLATSALTVGFGGSTGLESPMVSTGSAIGSTYGRVYNLSYKDRTILLACGASAGIAAAFNAPIAGVLFAVEVLLTDISASAFIPLIIAAATGALLSKIILQEGVILSFSLQQPFDYHNIPFYVALGVLAGLLSLYYAKAFTWVEERFKTIKNQWARALTGGILLFVLLLIFPPLFGEGYETIKHLAVLRTEELTKTSIITEWIKSDGHLLIFLSLLMFLKTVAAAITIGGGGNGGSFGPSLFAGAYLGFVFSRIVNMFGLSSIPESNFTIVAMAGVLSGVFYAPLTAIFLIAEITGGYELMIPLMVVSSLSLLIVHYFEPLSMEGKKLSRMLNVSVENRDKFVLSKLDLSSLIEKDFATLTPHDGFKELVKVVAVSKRNMFPVVSPAGKLVGIVQMDNIRPLLFDSLNHDTIFVKDLMTKPAAIIEMNENLFTVLKKFEDTEQWNLPVVNNDEYVGFVSKSSLLTKYRAELVESI